MSIIEATSNICKSHRDTLRLMNQALLLGNQLFGNAVSTLFLTSNQEIPLHLAPSMAQCRERTDVHILSFATAKETSDINNQKR